MNSIESIGRRLVKCKEECSGINNDHKSVVPRCLIVEKRKGKSCIVVGLNPGKCKDKEQDFYKSREKSVSYESIKNFFFGTVSEDKFDDKKMKDLLRKGIVERSKEKDKNGNKTFRLKANIYETEIESLYKKNHDKKMRSILKQSFQDALKGRAYYKNIRAVLEKWGVDGTILWTELVKCECAGANGDIPLQTVRMCTKLFLNKEISKSGQFRRAPIFALGNKSYEFCALMFPDRQVIGLPHPTGAHLGKKVWKIIERKPEIMKNKKAFCVKFSLKGKGSGKDRMWI